MVDRYNCYGWDIRRGEMRPEEDGKWVRYSDYAALDARLAEAADERDKALEELGKVIMACPVGQRSMPISTTVASMRARLSALEDTPPAPKVTEAMVELGARAIAKEWGEHWECCCSERKGLDCDCGDAMTDDRCDGYDERLSRDDCRIAARAALTAAQESGQ